MAGLFLWQATGKANPAWLYTVVAALTFLSSTFLAYRDERRRANKAENELNEVYADVVLSYLKETCKTQCFFQPYHIGEKLALPSEKVLGGLALLRDKYKLVKQNQLGWTFSAPNALIVTPGFKKQTHLSQKSESSAAVGL